ncbi:Glycosyltransferase sugar-binding region containing DXD motif, partial [Rhizoctonia solani]
MQRPRAASVRLPLYDTRIITGNGHSTHASHRRADSPDSAEYRAAGPSKRRRRIHFALPRRPKTWVSFLKWILGFLVLCLFALWRLWEPHIEIMFFRRSWIREEVLKVEPLVGCFRPENIARTSYNASWALDRPKRWEIQAGVPLRMGMDCYDFAGTVGRDKTQDTAEKHHTYFHTYWRKDLNPFGERQSWMLKSFFATQDLAHSTLILWSNGDLRDNKYVMQFTSRYPSTIFQVRRVNVDQLAKGTSLEGSSLLHQRDKRAWVDGDLIRLLVTWAEGGIWIDMDSLLTRDLSPLLEHEFVTQWDCYGKQLQFKGARAALISCLDKLYTPLNGALMHFYKHSPYLCEAFHIIGTSPPPRPGTTDWGSSLYLKVWRRLVHEGIQPFKVLPFCFSDGRSCRLDNRLPDPFKKDPAKWGEGRITAGDKTGLAEGGELDVALGNVFSVHLHNQWEKAFPPGGWVERLLLNRYDSRLSRWKRSEVPPEEAS